MKGCELNYSMNIKGVDFEKLISYGNLKRLKKTLKHNFKFVQFNSENIAVAYEIIKINRLSKGFPITMSFEQICEMQKFFPSNIFSFGLIDPNKNVCVASSICIKISEEILYVFYWGDLIEYSTYSPIVHLCKGIYDFCTNNNFSFLDVGTSTSNGNPNLGLINFKRNLGFRDYSKLTMQKKIGQ